MKDKISKFFIRELEILDACGIIFSAAIKGHLLRKILFVTDKNMQHVSKLNQNMLKNIYVAVAE